MINNSMFLNFLTIHMLQREMHYDMLGHQIMDDADKNKPMKIEKPKTKKYYCKRLKYKYGETIDVKEI